MTTVALIGPDGSGKTTVARRLEHELGRPVASFYMGINPDASTRQLPTTRLVWALRRRRGQRPDQGPPPAPSAGGSGQSRTKRARRELKTGLRVANLMAEEVYRSILVAQAERRGNVVLFDRHYFIDYHAHDVVARPGRGPARRLHGWFLSHVVPRPDLVVALDAPAEELLRRKGEGTVDDLRRRQADYEVAFAQLRVARVDATQPLDDVVADARKVILAFVEEGR